MNRRTALTSLLLSAGILIALFFGQNSFAKQSPDDKSVLRNQVPLTGHVLARVEHLTGYLENLLGGQRYDVFVFGTDNGQEQANPPVPVKVVYEFYRYEPNLPERFFDFSNRYELTVVRDTKCDESVKSLSYETDLVPGNPPSPRYILKVFNGAPADVLKPDLVLACFVLRPGKFRTVSRRKDP